MVSELDMELGGTGRVFCFDCRTFGEFPVTKERLNGDEEGFFFLFGCCLFVG